MYPYNTVIDSEKAVNSMLNAIKIKLTHNNIEFIESAEYIFLSKGSETYRIKFSVVLPELIIIVLQKLENKYLNAIKYFTWNPGISSIQLDDLIKTLKECGF